MTAVSTPVASEAVRDLLVSISDVLGSALESRWIVAQVTGMSARDLVAAPDRIVTPDEAQAARAMVERRVAGEPLQYVLGTWAFRTLELHVGPSVLIPRPETEVVVAVALEELRTQGHVQAPGSTLVAADLGTGSGAIALSLAAEYEPSTPIEVWATDISTGAIGVLDANLTDLAHYDPAAAARVRVGQGSWFDALASDLAGHLHLVVSNPPYVAQAEWEALDPVVRDYEPQVALVPGPTGFEALEMLLDEARRWLAPKGCLLVELAPGQASAAHVRATELGYELIEVRDDLAGRQRMLVARLPGT